jgi:hypothetical protein
VVCEEACVYLSWPWIRASCLVNRACLSVHRAQVSRTQFTTPTAFIFLYENQLFLTFRDRTVAVWNFKVGAAAK